MTDNRTVKQVAKSVATMRRRIAAIARKHAKLQARIAKLQADNRIVSIHKDAPIVAGVYNVWYVKADSLNPDKDTEWNWYYQVIFVEEHGVYQCSCEDVRHEDCKHVTSLSESFQPAKIEEEEQADGTIIVWSVSANGQRKEVARYRKVQQDRAAFVAAFDPCLVA